MRIVVVLPAPLGPRKPKISPSSTLRSTPRTAATVPFRALKVLVKPCVSISAMREFSLLLPGRLLPTDHKADHRRPRTQSWMVRSHRARSASTARCNCARAYAFSTAARRDAVCRSSARPLARSSTVTVICTRPTATYMVVLLTPFTPYMACRHGLAARRMLAPPARLFLLRSPREKIVGLGRADVAPGDGFQHGLDRVCRRGLLGLGRVLLHALWRRRHRLGRGRGRRVGCGPGGTRDARPAGSACSPCSASPTTVAQGPSRVAPALAPRCADLSMPADRWHAGDVAVHGCVQRQVGVLGHVHGGVAIHRGPILQTGRERRVEGEVAADVRRAKAPEGTVQRGIAADPLDRKPALDPVPGQ